MKKISYLRASVLAPCLAVVGSVAVAGPGCSSGPLPSAETSAREQEAVITPPTSLLVITDPAFTGSLTAFVNHKNATGMPTTLVTVASLVQQFPAVDEAASIKLGIDFYYRSAGTQYVFLVGDEKHVPTRYTGILPSEAVAPAYAHEGVGFRQSDLYYADLRTTPGPGEPPAFSTWDANGDGVYNAVAYAYSAYLYNPDDVDGLPEIAVGRLDVPDAASVTNYVNKVIAYETTGMPKAANLTMVADYNYPGAEVYGQGVASSFSVGGSKTYGEINDPSGTTPPAPWSAHGDSYPPGTDPSNTFVTQGAASSGWVFYVGHGNSQAWDDVTFATWDAMTQSNLPIVGAAGCQTGLYTAWSQDDHIDHPDTFPWGTTAASPAPAPNAPQPAPPLTLSNHVLAHGSTGGAIAYMGETQVMPNTEGAEFFADLGDCYSTSTGTPTLGALYQCAQTEYWNANHLYWTSANQMPVPDDLKEPRVYLSIMNLFGDPSLRLQAAAAPVTTHPGYLQVEGMCMQAPGTVSGSVVDIALCNDEIDEKWMMDSDGTVRPEGQPSMCLSPTGGSENNSTGLVLMPCSGPDAGKWTLGANGALVGPGGKCADDPYFNVNPGTQFDYWPCNGGTNQQFSFVPVVPPPVFSPPGSVQIEGKCMDLNAGNTTNGTHVQMWDCVGGAHQQWLTGSDGTIRYAAQPSKCLDLTAGNENNGTQLQIWDCAGPTGGAHQHWTFTSGALVGPGGKCADDPYFNTANGTVFDYWDCNGGASQQFAFRSLPGALSVEGVCMDLSSGNTNNGTPVQVWSCVGGAHQQWTIGSDGTIRYAAMPSKCLDLTGDAQANGTKLEISDCVGQTGSSEQHWALDANGQLTGPFAKCVEAANTNDFTVLDDSDCTLAANQTFTFKAN